MPRRSSVSPASLWTSRTIHRGADGAHWLTSESFFCSQNRAVLIKSAGGACRRHGCACSTFIRRICGRRTGCAQSLARRVWSRLNVKGWAGRRKPWIKQRQTLLGVANCWRVCFRAEEMPVASDDGMAGRGGKRPNAGYAQQPDYLFNGPHWFSQFGAKGSARVKQNHATRCWPLAPQKHRPASIRLSFFPERTGARPGPIS